MGSAKGSSEIDYEHWEPKKKRWGEDDETIITPPLDLRYRVRPVEDELRIRNPGNAECEEEEAIVASRMEKTAVATSFSLSSHLTRTVVGLAIDGFVPSFSPFKISEKWRLR